MKKVISLLLMFSLRVVAFSQYQPTPNIGLEIPANGSTNWNVPLNYNFNRLDQLLSGNLAIPALSVSGNITVTGSVTAGGFIGAGGSTFATSTTGTRYSPVYYSANPTGVALSGVAPFTGIAKYSVSAPPTGAVFGDIAGLWSGSGCSVSTNVLAVNGTCVIGAGSVSSPAFSVQLANSGLTGATSDPYVKVNTTTHDLQPQSLNGIQYVGVGAGNTTIQNTYSTATANNSILGGLTIPVYYGGSDGLTTPSTFQANAAILVGNGTNGTVGTIIAVAPLNLGAGYNCSSLPSSTLTLGTSGTAAVITANCVSGQITSYTISNHGTGYAQNAINPQLVMGLPPANPVFSNIDLRQGPQAYDAIVRVDDYGCRGDGATDNTNCINEAIAAAVEISNAHPHNTGLSALSFTSGGSYLVNGTPFNEPTGGDDGSPPQTGTCNGGAACTALTPLAHGQVPCAIQLPGNMIIYGNNSQLINNTYQAGSVIKPAMFCGTMNSVTINDLSIIDSIGIMSQQFFGLHLNNMTFALVNVAVLGGISDRSSTFNNITVTGMAGIVIGGFYECRGPSTLDGGTCAESGGYFDGQQIGNYIFNQLEDYAAAPNSNARYPNACTGTVPSGNVNDLHALDEWYDSLFYKSCISGVAATNTTAIPGLTFQINGAITGQGLGNGNNQTIEVDATTSSADVYANAGTLVDIFVKDQNGNSRTLQQIANLINKPTFGGVQVGTGTMRVNITGSPSTIPSASGAVAFSGGVNSSRLPDGQIQNEYRGIAGMGLAFYAMYGRPSGGVQLGTVVTEFPIRYPVFIQGQVNAINQTGFASIELGWNCNNHSAVVGSSTCPDPYNFFTPTTGSNCAAPNSSAVFIPVGSGTINAPSGFPYSCVAAVVDKVITVTNGAGQNVNVQPNRYVCADTQGFLTADSCYWDFPYLSRPNDSTNTALYHTFLGHLKSEPVSGSGSIVGAGDLVYSQNEEPVGSSGNNQYIAFRSPMLSFWNLIPANQGYNPDRGTFGLATDPLTTQINPSSIWYNLTEHDWKGYDSTNVLRFQATPSTTADGCASFTSNVLGSTTHPCISTSSTPSNGTLAMFTSSGVIGNSPLDTTTNAGKVTSSEPIVAPGFTSTGIPLLATGTASNSDPTGTITASGGTASYTFANTYTSAPRCVVQDDTTISNLLTKTVTTTTLTVTTTGSTDSVSYVCVGRN